MELSVVLIAEGGAGVRALQLLSERGHDVAAVFTDSANADSVASVASTAESLGVPRRPAVDVRDRGLTDWLRSRNIQLLLNVFALHILPADVCNAPTLGAFNLHPGPLPERAGLNVQSWAIYEGAKYHGVTVHHMTDSVDAGAIAFTDTFELDETATGLSVTLRCVQLGLPLLAELLAVAERGDPIPANPQDLSQQRWFDAGPPDDGRIDWTRSAADVVRFVRACDYGPFESPWGHPHTTRDGERIGLLSADVDVDGSPPTEATPGTVTSRNGATVTVATGNGLVRLEKLSFRDRPVPAAQHLQPGDRLQ